MHSNQQGRGPLDIIGDSGVAGVRGNPLKSKDPLKSL